MSKITTVEEAIILIESADYEVTHYKDRHSPTGEAFIVWLEGNLVNVTTDTNDLIEFAKLCQLKAWW